MMFVIFQHIIHNMLSYHVRKLEHLFKNNLPELKIVQDICLIKIMLNSVDPCVLTTIIVLE